MGKEPIDFVVTWVDDSDPNWLEKKSKVLEEKPIEFDGNERYRDWDTLKYWFRGVEKFAPWVNNIYFVTDHQKPEWLNVEHPKLKLINHTDYIPKEYLPTFNSHTIIFNIYRIKDLSENFVLFNDDVFLIDDVNREDFFVNNVPCDSPKIIPFRSIGSFTHIMLNNYLLCKKHFKIKSSFLKNFNNWIKAQDLRTLFGFVFMGKGRLTPAFRDWHIQNSYNKTTFDELWDSEFDTLNETCLHKVRDSKDVSDWCVRYWQLFSNNFCYKKPIGKCFETADITENNKAIKYIKKQKGKIVCLNDTECENNFEEHKNMLIDAFESILPEKSSFEL